MPVRLMLRLVFFGAPGGPFDEFKLDPNIAEVEQEMEKHFDFNSAATSPGVSAPQASGIAHSIATNSSTRPSVESEVWFQTHWEHNEGYNSRRSNVRSRCLHPIARLNTTSRLAL